MGYISHRLEKNREIHRLKSEGQRGNPSAVAGSHQGGAGGAIGLCPTEKLAQFDDRLSQGFRIPDEIRGDGQGSVGIATRGPAIVIRKMGEEDIPSLGCEAGGNPAVADVAGRHQGVEED